MRYCTETTCDMRTGVSCLESQDKAVFSRMAFVSPQEAAARSATWGSHHPMSSLGLYKVSSHHQGLHIQIIRVFTTLLHSWFSEYRLRKFNALSFCWDARHIRLLYNMMTRSCPYLLIGFIIICSHLSNPCLVQLMRTGRV